MHQDCWQATVVHTTRGVVELPSDAESKGVVLLLEQPLPQDNYRPHPHHWQHQDSSGTKEQWTNPDETSSIRIRERRTRRGAPCAADLVVKPLSTVRQIRSSPCHCLPTSGLLGCWAKVKGLKEQSGQRVACVGSCEWSEVDAG